MLWKLNSFRVCNVIFISFYWKSFNLFFYLFFSSRHSSLHGNDPRPVRPDLSLLWQKPYQWGCSTDRGCGEWSLIQTSGWCSVTRKEQHNKLKFGFLQQQVNGCTGHIQPETSDIVNTTLYMYAYQRSSLCIQRESERRGPWRKIRYPQASELKSNWKEDNNAERIFKLLPERDTKCYSALIRGMVKVWADSLQVSVVVVKEKLTSATITCWK